MTRRVWLTVNEHDVGGSSLHVLRAALLREVRHQRRRLERNSSPAGREMAHRELVAARRLAEEAGCGDEALAGAGAWGSRP